MASSSARRDNVAAESPVQCQSTCAESTTTCEALSDQAWAQAKYLNFRLFVRSLVPQEPKLAEWADWLDKLPLAVFLAGGDGELRGVRGASDDDTRERESDLCLQRFAVQWDFDIDLICGADRKTLRRYIALFSSV